MDSVTEDRKSTQHMPDNIYFTISPEWVKRASEAIGARNGVVFKDALSRAEAGEALVLHSGTRLTVRRVTKRVALELTNATDAYLQRFPLPLRVGGGGGDGNYPNPHNHNHDRPNRPARRRADDEARASQEEERKQCILTAVRVAMTGSIVAHQRTHGCIVTQAVSSPIASTSAAAAQAAAAATATAVVDVDAVEALESQALRRSCCDTLLKGMLFAFEAFAPMHAMGRDHYPPRVGSKTAGTVGWDTLVLLHFVHHIPQIARDASGAVIDAATGELVRSWRKLLIALQSVDATEAAEHSRRRGALALANGLLIIMFQRYNTHQCAVFLSAIDHAEGVAKRTNEASKSILQPSLHMVSEVVTYYYYRGRMALYERRYQDAHDALREAYHLLPPSGNGGSGGGGGGGGGGGTAAQHSNKQRVRFFMMVAGLLSGRRTPQTVLDADPLLARLFSRLVSAVESGNPVAFDAALEKDGPVWWRRGVYLMLQSQARLLCYATLMARTHAAVGALPGRDNSRLTLANLIAAYNSIVASGEGSGGGGSDSVKTQGSGGGGDADGGHTKRKGSKRAGVRRGKKRGRETGDDDDDDDGDDEEAAAAAAETVDAAVREAEGGAMNDDRMALWVVKLIARGYVRGYLSHEHKTVVLSKKEPFPALTAQPQQPTSSSP